MNIAELEQKLESKDKNINRLAIECLLLRLRDSLPTADIAKTLDVSQRTIQRYIKQFKEGSNFQAPSAGKFVSNPELKMISTQSPPDYGYLLEQWIPDMLHQETGASYSSCRRMLVKVAKLGSLSDAILKLKKGERLEKNLRRKYSEDSQLWIVHSFTIGDDRNRKPKGHIDYIKQYQCYLSVSLYEPQFLVEIQVVSTKSPRVDSIHNRKQNRYSGFLQRVCTYVLAEFEAPTILLLGWTPQNRSVIPIVKSEAQATACKHLEKRHARPGQAEQPKKKVTAQFFPNSDYPLHQEIRSFESHIRNQMMKFKKIDNDSLRTLKGFANEWWINHHPAK